MEQKYRRVMHAKTNERKLQHRGHHFEPTTSSHQLIYVVTSATIAKKKCKDAPFNATESVLDRRVKIISFIVVTSSSRAVAHSPASTLMQGNGQRCTQQERRTHLRLAAAHVTGVQAGVADCVLVAQPGKEALQTETVATVGRRAVSVRFLLVWIFS